MTGIRLIYDLYVTDICWTARSMERSIFFFLKSHISAPGAQNSPIFFPSVIYPLYLHVIIDFSHIWGPFMAEIEKMCQKSAFLVVPDFGYPQSRGPPWKLAHWKCCPNCFWWLLYMLGLCHFIFATFSNEFSPSPSTSPSPESHALFENWLKIGN